MNKHRLYRRSKKLQGRGFFSEIGKKILGIVGNKAKSALQDKAQQVIEKKLSSIFSKKIQDENQKKVNQIFLKNKIQDRYGTGLKIFSR